MRAVSLKVVMLSWLFFSAGCGGTDNPSDSTEGGEGGAAALTGGSGGSGGTVGSGGLESSGGSGTGGDAVGSGGSGTGGDVVGSGGSGTGGDVVGSGGSGTGGDVVGSGGSGGDVVGSGGDGSGGDGAGGDLGSGGTGGDGSGGDGTGGDGTGGDGTGGDGTGGGTTELELITSGPNDYWNTDAQVTEVSSGSADLTIDPNTTYQRWDGFGGTFNEMGWDALNVLSSSEITRALTLLFDATDGANFVYGRIPIGASDYSMSWYTLAETANDYAMDNFSIDRDRQMLIPYIQAALQIRPDIRLWGSPWIVPDWMMNGRDMRSDAQTLEAHALYLAKFVEEYGNEGMTIEAVHPQNEPGYARVNWGQQVLIDYFKTYLGPKFAERNLSAEIWCGTMSAPEDANIATGVANDPDSMQYVTGFGLQWNHEDTTADLAPFGPVMQTEHRCGNYSFSAPYWDQSRYDSNTPQNDHLYGEESWQLIRDWIVGGVNSYLAWNMVLDTQGHSLDGWPQNALLVVDRSGGSLIETAAYYVFRHYSQFILPGATRIGTSGTNDAVAFQNADGSIVTEVYNSGDSSNTMTVDVAGAMYQFDVPAHGWATLTTP